MKTSILGHILAVAIVVLMPVAGAAETGDGDGGGTQRSGAEALMRSTPLTLLANSRGCTSPGNETCAGATAITFSQIAAGYSTSGQLGCTDDCSGRGYFDVFYSYDCTCTGSYTFDMCDSDGDTYLRVFSGSCCGTQVGSNDDSCGNLDPTLTLTLNAGTSYWIECGSYSSTGMENSSYNFNATTTCVPPCMDFTVTAPYTSPTRSTCGAGNDCALRSTEEHIYEVTIPCAGDWMFSLCGSSYDTYLLIGTTCCGSELGSNDDSGPACSGLQSSILLTSLAAGTYYVDVEGYSGCGDYILDIYLLDPCDSSTTMSDGVPYSGTLSTCGAWNGPYSGCSWSEPGEEHVYQFTTSNAGTYTLTANTSTGDPDFFLMSSCDPAGTNIIGTCWGGGTQTPSLSASTTYYFIVDNYSSSSSAGYTIQVDYPPSCTSPTATVDDASGCGSVVMTCSASGGSGGSILYNWYSGTACSGTVLGTGSTYTATTSGNYACKAYIDGFEGTCEACDYGYATVNPLPANPTNAQATPGSICVGASSDVSVDVTAISSTTWTFDSDLDGWTATANCTYTDTWAWASDGGVGAAYAPDVSVNSSQVLTSPSIDVSSMTAVTLSYLHRYSSESCCDHGYVAYRLDGGAWTQFFPTVGSYSGQDGQYNEPLWNSCSTSSAMYLYYGTGSYATHSGNITVSGASTLEIAFVFTSDSSVGADGWYLDEVSVGEAPVVDWYTSSCGGTFVATGNPLSVSPTSTTTYYALARSTVSGCYCAACDDVTVTVNSLPTAPTGGQSNPAWICPGDSADISASVGGGETIDWYTGSCGGTFAGTGNPLSVNPTATTTYYGVARNTSTGCESSSCVSVTVDVDNGDPSFTYTPPDVMQNADAGGCDALVSISSATASDAYDTSVDVTYERSDNPALTLGDPFPAGTTTVTWTATDDCSHTATHGQTVTIDPLNDLIVDVELLDVTQSSLTRCITFDLYDCDGTNVAFDEEVAFTNGLASSVPLTVDCGDYDCILVRDELHTLARLLNRGAGLNISGTDYVASFTGTGDGLIGGNLNDDGWVDIIDFVYYVNRWGNSGSANTTCPPSGVHADISGNGLVDTADFTFIQTYFLVGADDDCCGTFLRGEDQGPLSAISVDELYELGLGHLRGADLNNDGMIDTYDVVDFANGVRPAPPHSGDIEPEYEGQEAPYKMESTGP